MIRSLALAVLLSAAPAAAQIPKGMKNYVVAFLVEGPNRSQSDAEVQTLQALHLAYIQRQVVAGKYTLAGPFIDGGRIRGMVIVNVADAKAAEAILREDPAVKAGRLDVEVHPAILPEIKAKIIR